MFHHSPSLCASQIKFFQAKRNAKLIRSTLSIIYSSGFGLSQLLKKQKKASVQVVEKYGAVPP
jgi:hypothetical protein